MTATTDYGPHGLRTERAQLAETHSALVETLSLAVPMRIWDLRDHTPEQRCAIARRCATVVASEGDTLMFGGSKKGAAAKVFNQLAEGLACAAYQPGGVTFAGRHWCTDHAACRAAERGEPGAGEHECGDAMFGNPARTRPVETVTPTSEWGAAL